MAHNFPAELELECIRDIIEIVRAGDVQRREQLEIVQHAAWFIGSGAALLEQQIDADLVTSAASDLTEQADQLEALLPSEGDAVAALPWLEIAKVLIPILIQLLLKESEDDS